MKILPLALIGSGLLMVSTASRAQESAAKAPEAKEEKKPEGDRPHVDAALGFLRGLAHSSRSGDAGEKGWAEAKEHAGDTVVLKISGKDLIIDLAGKKSEARLVRFAKIATLRDGATVKGVTAENVQVQLGNEPHSGKAWLLMEEKDGKWRVTSIEVD